MADVAERVGISAITVSRAFKRPELVAPELRQRILDTAQSMGYVPNQAASALASARSMTVAVLIPSMTNMVFVETLAGIHDMLLPRGGRAAETADKTPAATAAKIKGEIA